MITWNAIIGAFQDNCRTAVELELGLDDRKEFFRSLLSTFCTTAEGDMVASFETIKPAIGEAKTKIMVPSICMLNNSIRIKLSIDIPSMT
jgi:hypothetical protein